MVERDGGDPRVRVDQAIEALAAGHGDEAPVEYGGAVVQHAAALEDETDLEHVVEHEGVVRMEHSAERGDHATTELHARHDGTIGV